MTSYTQTLNYLYTQLPMFTRVGEAAYKPNLDNTLKLLEALNNPHLKLKFIHVAGTNGKGSTSNMLAAILQRAGYKTGLYTSPHLLDFRERIRVNGSMISKAFVVKFVAHNKALFLEIKPSFFEMTVALCFVYFAQQKTDIAIIETGLGGRLDSTNVIVPLLSIITNIGLDHTNLLGNTLQEIALEKAGIIKEKIPIVIGETDAITKKVFTAKAKACNSELVFADKRMKIEVLSKNDTSIKIKVLERNKVWLEKVSLSLVGNYQLKNVATVLQSIRFLQMHFAIAAKDIQYGLGHIQALTGFAGRWQVVQKNPMVILDTGHNAHGLRQSIKQLVERKAKKIHIVFGVVRDKKLDDILPLLPLDAHYYLCAPQLPRVLPVEELEQVFSKHNFEFTACESVEDAYKYAHKRCKKNEIIFVGGSTFVVAEVLTFLVKNKKIP
ncbi:MAG: bifunctional folylpolyglutamate synthase/dihydrofolate synthase [Bacteroidetes bacterium]|nr:bifunctional folylpolyglutamate synthase/dihydrofolate synthase [Bacteroidota bacterium]